MGRFDDVDKKRDGILSWAPVVLPFATAAVALVGGIALGVGGTYVLRPADVRPRDLTAVELNTACLPMVAQVTAQLDEANHHVDTLVTEVKAKEAKVNALETEMKRRGTAGASMKKQLDSARAELAEAKRQLKVAIKDKEDLVVQLKSALVDLDTQKVKTQEAKQQALDYGWQAFVSGSQLQVCERGNRKKLGKCREAVVDVLAPMHDEYQQCLRTGQATPSLVEAEKKQEDIPRFARWLDQDDRIVKGWYVQLCDPTLPEAKDGAPLGARAAPKDLADVISRSDSPETSSRASADPTAPLADQHLATDTRVIEKRDLELGEP
jgi:hypothetical protein